MIIISESNKGTKRINEDFMKEVKNNPVSKKIKSIASKYRYEAGDSYIRSYGKVDIPIHPKGKFHPEVRYESGTYGYEGFTIQTTAYGSLTEKEYAEFLKGCNDAYKMVQELNKLDLTQLIKEPDRV